MELASFLFFIFIFLYFCELSCILDNNERKLNFQLKILNFQFKIFIILKFLKNALF